MGAAVWWTGKPYSRVHARPNCYTITHSRRKGQRELPLAQHDLAQIVSPEFCLTCFPDAPRKVRVHHQICGICSPEKLFPCEHNGAVRVRVRIRNGMKNADPDRSTYIAERWAWPENVSSHTLVNPVHQR